MPNSTLVNFDYPTVLEFWFSDLISNPDSLAPQAKMWFTGGEELDRQITERFSHYFSVLEGVSPDQFENEHQLLAAVIVLDQFSRNCFRGQARAFAYDSLALALLDWAIEKEWDKSLHTIERTFLYMPLQHAESLSRQRQSLVLFDSLADEAEGVYNASAKGSAQHAKMHFELIERFGRFPHRNRVLDRAPTAEETAYLADGGKTFGQ